MCYTSYMNQKKRTFKCQSCKKLKPDVRLRACGYNQDIHNETVMERVCDACEHEHIMDI